MKAGVELNGSELYIWFEEGAEDEESVFDVKMTMELSPNQIEALRKQCVRTLSREARRRRNELKKVG